MGTLEEGRQHEHFGRHGRKGMRTAARHRPQPFHAKPQDRTRTAQHRSLRDQRADRGKHHLRRQTLVARIHGRRAQRLPRY